jgi:hypothetical protein
MRPRSVVLVYENSKLWRYELFYSAAKAERAHHRALSKDRDGFTTLESEDGGFNGTSAALTVRLVHLNWIGTEKEFHRKTLLNLTSTEMDELCNRFNLPRNIIEHVAQAERDTFEAKRYHLSKFNERTIALMRKHLPSFVLSWIFY